MEAKEKKEKKKRKPTAWLYEDGKKTRFTHTPSGKLSAFAIHKREHPEEWVGEILDMRAVMK